MISYSRKAPKLLRGMRDKLNVMVGDHVSRMTPEILTSQTRAIIWSVSNVSPAPATEEAIVDCVVFFKRRGKAARIFEKETRLDVK